MLGSKQETQAAVFFGFSIDDVLRCHLLRSIGRLVYLTVIRLHSAPVYGNTGRPSIDPWLLIRTVLAGFYTAVDTAMSIRAGILGVDPNTTGC